MSYDSLVNRGDYFSAHYLAEVLPKDLKSRFKEWGDADARERDRAKREGTSPRPVSPRGTLRALRARYTGDRQALADHTERLRSGAGLTPERRNAHHARLRDLHRELLTALGFEPKPGPVELVVERGAERIAVPVALREPTLAAVECGWAPDVDAALDPHGAGALLTPLHVGPQERVDLGTKLVTWLFAEDEGLRYVLLLAGGVVVLADRATWGEGRYLAVSLDIALSRNDPDELGTIAALFGADSLLPPEDGGAEPLTELLEKSRNHAVGVSTELRAGLQQSVEFIAEEVLTRLAEQGVRPEQLADSADDFARELSREALRYLYRVLFLLYAEAKPELGVVPADDEAYMSGYSMARLGDLVVKDLVGEEARTSVHLYESLDVLFRMVNEGHRPRGHVLTEEEAAALSEGEGLRFEPLRADLFDPTRTRLIGTRLPHPDTDPDEPTEFLDTRLRNETLHRVLRLLMLAPGRRVKKERGGFISYAQLGINQLGAVYEGLMSYTGFIATEPLYEAAKNGDPSNGSWLVPQSRVEDYPDSVWVMAKNDDGHPTGERVMYNPGGFVYRLAGRDRETSASYYTPESLTSLTVQLTLRERLDQNDETTPACDLLNWTICEPALGSGAFLNEAINQVSAEYLRRRQRELGKRIDPERYTEELQKVKAYIALHRCYGVDLNATAVELAEVSLWLNVMHQGLRAPWFGLHLRRGNSLVGAGRRSYAPTALAKAAWLTQTPEALDASPPELKSALATVDTALATAGDAKKKAAAQAKQRRAEAEKDGIPTGKRDALHDAAATLQALADALTETTDALTALAEPLRALRRAAADKPHAESLHQPLAAVRTGAAEVTTAVNRMGQALERPHEAPPGARATRTSVGEAAAALRALAAAAWLDAEPYDWPTTQAEFPTDHVHQFLLPAKGWGSVAAEKEAKALAEAEAKRLADWRKAIRKAPTTTRPRGKGPSQVERLQRLSRRAEFLWAAVTRRLELSEREISRHIDVWGADDLDQPTEAVPREKVLADLERAGTPYWRLKTLLDTWCALWFWPVQRAGLLDGSDPEYDQLDDTVSLADLAPAAAEQASDPAPVSASDATDALGAFPVHQESLFGEDQGVLDLGSGAAPRRQGAKPPEPARVTETGPVAPRDLDGWLTFAEALLGAAEIPEDSLFAELDSLAALDEREAELPRLMGQADPHTLVPRFPWLHTARRIAEDHAFFHWELQFAPVFARGGFDLQVGNPPWVRPTWNEDAVLAEHDPWFGLAEKAAVEKKRERKAALLERRAVRDIFLGELAGVAGLSDYLSDVATYPLLAGTQPDLYRAFMCRVWEHQAERGNAGLIHPDTHFGDAKAGPLRAAAYPRLRYHFHFANTLLLFEIKDSREYGVHVYGAPRGVGFVHSAWNLHPSTVEGSLVHDGEGEKPGYRYQGSWDLRPHQSRLVWVTPDVLGEWQHLTGDFGDVSEARLIYPITSGEAGAISCLTFHSQRLGMEGLCISSGYHEKLAKVNGLIFWETSQAGSLDEVVLQGPHVGIAAPFGRQPNMPFRHKNDYESARLTSLSVDFIPRSNYRRATDIDSYLADQDVWDGRPYSSYFRLAWRDMIDTKSTERSLFAGIIPPGPAHVHTVKSMVVYGGNRSIAIASGFWAALPLDYLLRITGRGHLQHGEAAAMPHGSPTHPLAAPLLLRTLRLNCLTNAYTELWAELYDSAWRQEEWAVDWPELAPLGAVTPEWEYGTPLRTERERRAALVELDAMVALWLGMTADQLVAIYKSRYPVLFDREAEMWFDSSGRKIAASHHTYGHGQTKDHYLQLRKHLESPDAEPVPEGYSAPFYKADREAEYRQAHAVFTERVARARAAGEWQPEAAQ